MEKYIGTPMQHGGRYVTLHFATLPWEILLAGTALDLITSQWGRDYNGKI